MSHELRSDELSAYLDGELDGKQRQAVESHLESCSACRATLSEFQRQSASLKNTKGSYLAESFVMRVRARIRSGSDDQVSWVPAERLARRTVFALAIVVAVAVGSFWNQAEPVSGIVEGYYQVAQQDSVLNRILNAETAPTKEDLLLAVMAK